MNRLDVNTFFGIKNVVVKTKFWSEYHAYRIQQLSVRKSTFKALFRTNSTLRAYFGFGWLGNCF